MGFCGCSLYTSTIIAAVFGIILSIYGVSWTAFFLAFSRDQIPINNITSPFQLIFFNSSSDCLVTKDIITTSLVIHAIWLITSLLLIQGNKKSIQSLMLIWISVTAATVLTDITGTGYFIYKAVDALPRYENSTQLMNLMGETAFLPYIIIAALFSKLGTILIFVLISLMVFVWKRTNAVKEQKNFFLKHRYSCSSTESAPSHTADQQRVIYSSREILPPAYNSQSLDSRQRTGYSVPDNHHKQQYMIPPPLRSDSLKPNYGHDNFGFAIPHLPHAAIHSGRVLEPEIDYEDNKVIFTSRDRRY